MNDNNFYVLNACKYPLLTNEEEIILARRVQVMISLLSEKGDEPLDTKEKRIVRSGKRAKDRMFLGNTRLVINIARKYEHRCHSMTLWDICQEGMIGLSTAIDKFDPERGYKFSTYAYWWVIQSIRRGMATRDRVVRIPVHVEDAMWRARQYAHETSQETGKQPSLEEMAKHGKVSIENLRHAFQAMPRHNSLDASVLEDGSPMVTLIEAPVDNTVELQDQVDLIRASVGILPEIAQKILIKFHGFGCEPMTLRDIAKELKISPERTRQLRNRAHLRLRRHLAEQRHNDYRPSAA